MCTTNEQYNKQVYVNNNKTINKKQHQASVVYVYKSKTIIITSKCMYTAIFSLLYNYYVQSCMPRFMQYSTT